MRLRLELRAKTSGCALYLLNHLATIRERDRERERAKEREREGKKERQTDREREGRREGVRG